MIYAPSFPLQLDDTYGFKNVDDTKELVRFHLINLLFTEPGEKISNAAFRVGIRRYLFENFNSQILPNIEARIENQIRNYLSYLILGEVKVFEDIDIIQLRIGVVLRKKIINLLSLNLLLSIPVPGQKNNYFPWIHVDDIVGFVNHSINSNLSGAFNLVGTELISHESFFKSIQKYKKSVIPWVLFIPSTLTKLFFGKMSEMFLYGPKTKPVKTLNSNYKFKYPTLQEALLNLSE